MLPAAPLELWGSSLEGRGDSVMGTHRNGWFNDGNKDSSSLACLYPHLYHLRGPTGCEEGDREGLESSSITQDVTKTSECPFRVCSSTVHPYSGTLHLK